MPSPEELREIVARELPAITKAINSALQGKFKSKLEKVLARVGRGGKIPHWYEALQESGALPNLDGKTIGSVVEMLLVAVLETVTFKKLKIPPLTINPAKGVDLPDLELGVKSPSENFCTSEPFFSAYERLIGNEHDLLVLLTDYQTAKAAPPLRLKIIESRYLRKTQVADKHLCAFARKHRQWLLEENEAWAKKAFRFLSFINQGDWRARKLLAIFEAANDDDEVKRLVARFRVDFEQKNKEALQKDKPLIPEEDIVAIEKIVAVSPIIHGVIDALDNWVVDAWKDVGRLPNDNEWNRLKTGPLDGMIGMSFALQWRYNFSQLFGGADDDCD